MTGRLFIFGLGFSGLAIARRAAAAGWTVTGTVTTEEKAARLRSPGIDVELFPARAALAKATHVLVTIPPDAASDKALPVCTGIRPAWLGYLSTTGVYGDTGGAWVDETAEPRPGPPRSRQRLAAERAWQAFGRSAGVPVDIFRLPAIYGPGRSALDQVRAGTARRIDKPGQVFCRIHLDDLASAVLAAMARPDKTGAIYNVADDEPAPQGDVIALACQLLGRPVPDAVPWAEAAPGLSDMARSFYAENRRVRAERVKRELGVVLKYPTYREGLGAILAAASPAPA